MWSSGGEKGEPILGEGGAYFGVPTQAILGKISYWDDILSKRGKHEIESLDACYRGW